MLPLHYRCVVTLPAKLLVLIRLGAWIMDGGASWNCTNDQRFIRALHYYRATAPTNSFNNVGSI